MSTLRRRRLWITFLLLCLLCGACQSFSRRSTDTPPAATAPSVTHGQTSNPTPVHTPAAPPATRAPSRSPASSTLTPSPGAVTGATVYAASPTPRSTTATAGAPAQAKIEILWPHGGASPRDAELANLTAYLLTAEGQTVCNWSPRVQLWSALNNEPARPLGFGTRRMAGEQGRLFPAWDFNDVNISKARDSVNKISFFVTVEGTETYRNVWVHAMDARTIQPRPDIPTGVATGAPASVDARIEILWPRDGKPVHEADRANLTVYLFEVGTMHAFSDRLSWRPTVRLHRSLNAEPERAGTALPAGVARSVAEGPFTFLVWDFSDVDISAARDPLNRIHFWVSVDGIPTYSNIWVHAQDARTISPQVDTLSACR